jgi:hypothetical protein
VAIYAEHDVTAPPFAWERGAAVDDDAGRSRVHDTVGLVAREGGRGADRPDSRAVRLGTSALLVETDLGRSDRTGRPTRVSIVVEHPADLADHLGPCADEVTRALADADLGMAAERVRAALAWGLASTRPRLPRLDALLRWALAVLGRPQARWNEQVRPSAGGPA